ncbi:BRO-N domain-containing protein [Ruthenibacterium lactatiformans]|uniref:BRO-N domain-containing protein n=1 Tax=Ruthenibacterium lactatiformans TaxID=1550024 RepID=UPI0035228FFE
MNELKIFAYSGEELRTIQREDGLWWVLRDVCRVLGITNHKMVAQRLDEDEVSLADLIDALGRTQKTTIINEPGPCTRSSCGRTSRRPKHSNGG